jgi:hypothetical protein
MTAEQTIFNTVMGEIKDIRNRLLEKAYSLSFGEDQCFNEECYDEDKSIYDLINTYDGEINLFCMYGKDFTSRLLYGLIDEEEYLICISDYDDKTYREYISKENQEMFREWKKSGNYFHN